MRRRWEKMLRLADCLCACVFINALELPGDMCFLSALHTTVHFAGGVGVQDAWLRWLLLLHLVLCADSNKSAFHVCIYYTRKEALFLSLCSVVCVCVCVPEMK